MVQIDTIFVYGYSTIWKFQSPQLRLVERGVWWAEAGRRLRTPSYDHRTGLWKSLPEGLTQSAPFESPYAWKNGIAVVDMDDASEFFDELLGR